MIGNLGDAFESLAVVPVGLTRCQKNSELQPYGREGAAAVLAAVERWQQKYFEERGSRFVFASDEFYLLAGREVPPEDEYEGYAQIENGVGLVRQFWEDFEYEKEKLPASLDIHAKLRFISAVDGKKAIEKKVASLGEIVNLDCDILTVNNHFFGETVTVTGLLTGEDIIAALERETGDKRIYLLPDIVLKHGETLLLDDVSVDEIREVTGQTIVVVPSDAVGLIDYIRSLT